MGTESAQERGPCGSWYWAPSLHTNRVHVVLGRNIGHRVCTGTGSMWFLGGKLGTESTHQRGPCGSWAEYWAPSLHTNGVHVVLGRNIGHRVCTPTGSMWFLGGILGTESTYQRSPCGMQTRCPIFRPRTTWTPL